MEITRIFTFCAAHRLPNYIGPCKRLHGHTYRLAVTVEGPVKKNGFVIDFVKLKKFVEKEVISRLDHNNLNDLLKTPSAENIAIWIWRKLKNIGKLTRTGVKLEEIKLWEGDNNYVEYEGD